MRQSSSTLTDGIIITIPANLRNNLHSGQRLFFLLSLVICGLLVKFYGPTSNWWVGYLFVIFPLTPAIYLIAKYRRDRMALKRIVTAASLTSIALYFALEGISLYIILKNVNPVAHYSGLVCGISFPYIAYPLSKR